MSKDRKDSRTVIPEHSSAFAIFQVINRFHDPVGTGVVTDIKMTLFNAGTGEAVINSQSGTVSVFNLNGGTYTPELTVSTIEQEDDKIFITTTVDHELYDGMLVHVVSVGGMTEINNRTFRITKVTNTKLLLTDEDGTDHTAWTSGGTLRVGLFVMALAPADNPIVDTTLTRKKREIHIAQFEIFAGGQHVHEPYEFDVEQLSKVT